MPAAPVKTPAAAARSHKSDFFRQSGWMMIAAVISGVFMLGVHFFSKRISREEYGVFGTLLQVTNWISIPALGLQMVFAQQTAAAITELQKRQLAATLKAVMRWTFCVWLVMAVIAVVCHRPLIAALKLRNPASLWLTIAVGLVMLWLPVFQGLLQGRQNFLWLGWTTIFNGVGRVLIGGIIVYALAGQAAGMMAGVFIGLAVALAAAAWQNLDLWKETSAPFDARGWLKRVVPLTLGFGASAFIFSADQIVVQNYFGNDEGSTAPYTIGATLCRAIVLFTAPLGAVLFPKLVHGAARSQKTNLLGVALLGTGALSVVAVLGLTLTSSLVIRLVSKPEYISIVPLIPLFAAAMVPLGMGNVLLNNLMAHSRFKIVPALVILAAGYWVALQHFHDSFKMVVQTFGVFSVMFLIICAVFTWATDMGPTAAKEHGKD